MAKKQTTKKKKTKKKTQTIEKFIKFISELWNIIWIFLSNSKGRTVLSISTEVAILQAESVYIPHTRLLCLHHITQVKGDIQFEFLCIFQEFDSIYDINDVLCCNILELICRSPSSPLAKQIWYKNVLLLFYFH